MSVDAPPGTLPRHIAIIMDGNGRWAVKQNLERVKGHQQGARVVQKIVTECAHLRRTYGGPDHLTLYSFSLENWKRPMEEAPHPPPPGPGPFGWPATYSTFAPPA